jgi:hypothetical protein
MTVNYIKQNPKYPRDFVNTPTTPFWCSRRKNAWLDVFGSWGFDEFVPSTKTFLNKGMKAVLILVTDTLPPSSTSSSSSSSSSICQTTGPQPLPKRFLHLMRSRASSFK